MTTKLASAFAAVALTVGILVGAAGTVLVHDATRTPMGMTDARAMHQMMGGMGGSLMNGPTDASQHEVHHPGSDR
jgi:hypothetical protein